jgi:hypothetical protein
VLGWFHADGRRRSSIGTNDSGVPWRARRAVVHAGTAGAPPTGCCEAEDDPDVDPTCHRAKGRGKTVHPVGLEKQNVKENHKILKMDEKPPNRRSSLTRG